MFLDEELQQIYDNDKDDIVEVCNKLLNVCINRIRKDSPKNFINSIRQIDSSFRIFARKTNIINEDGFKLVISDRIKQDEKADIIFKYLKW